MTGAEWMACDEPQRLLENLGDRWSDRKLRLFGCACLRLEPWRQDERLQAIVSIAEKYADGAATVDELEDAYERGDELLPDPPSRLLPKPPMKDALSLATAPANSIFFRYFMGQPFEKSLSAGQRRVVCQFIRCIFGNPLRPPSTVPTHVLHWNDATVRRIAEGICEEGTFERLLILHDALLDAGCDGQDILAHCRSEGPHVRGCWVIDLLLGKE